jgi:ribosomal protein L29
MNREEILENSKEYRKKTVKEMENEIDELYKRIANLKIIIEAKDLYIEDLRKLINELKTDQKNINI